MDFIAYRTKIFLTAGLMTAVCYFWAQKPERARRPSSVAEATPSSVAEVEMGNAFPIRLVCQSLAESRDTFSLIGNGEGLKLGAEGGNDVSGMIRLTYRREVDQETVLDLRVRGSRSADGAIYDFKSTTDEADYIFHLERNGRGRLSHIVKDRASGQSFPEKIYLSKCADAFSDF